MTAWSERKRCDNCGDKPTKEFPVMGLLCGHWLCAYCVKDGCMICSKQEEKP